MKMVTKGILFTLVLFVCFSCSQGENSAEESMAKKDPAKTEKMKKGSAKKTDNNKYWGALRKELNLDADQLKQVRQLTNKNTVKVSALSEAQGENYLEQIKKIRVAEKAKVKSILGEELYQKKLAFDKTWAQNATAPKGRK